MLEREFQKQLIREIKARFPGCIVLHNDPQYVQGIPDLLILYGNKWAALEVKRAHNAPRRPNQEYYVKLMNRMSFARFIWPDNKEDVLNELERSFETEGKARVPECLEVPLDSV